MPRKSTLGTRGLQPIRLVNPGGGNSPSSPGISPRTKLGATRTPHAGSYKKVSPIRWCDLSVKDQSRFLSSKKKENPSRSYLKSPRTRRCLYRDDNITERVESPIPSVRKFPKTQNKQERSIPRIAIHHAKSNIPRPGSVKKRKSTVCTKRNSLAPTQRSTVSNPGRSVHPMVTGKSTACKTQSTSDNIKANKSDVASSSMDYYEILNQVKQIAEEQKSLMMEALSDQRKFIQDVAKLAKEQTGMLQEIAEEQKKMQQEAKNTFSKVLLEQRNILEALRGNMEAPISKNIFQETRRLSNNEFSILEHQFESESAVDTQKEGERKSLGCNKENSTQLPARKSLAAYREMKKSFSCLGTPTSARKLKTPRARTPKTPRSKLKARVQAQLENLLDD